MNKTLFCRVGFKQLFLTFLLFLMSVNVWALPPTLDVGAAKLQLNGEGVRTRFVIRAYRAGLYLSEKSKDATTILSSNKPMAIRLKILSGLITAEKMQAATNEGFHNATNGNTAPIQSQIAQFMSAFKEKINKGDTYDFVYIPGSGTHVFKNTKQSATIQGEAFKKALFGIWLSNKPADGGLKAALLGGQ